MVEQVIPHNFIDVFLLCVFVGGGGAPFWDKHTQITHKHSDPLATAKSFKHEKHDIDHIDGFYQTDYA